MMQHRFVGLSVFLALLFSSICMANPIILAKNGKAHCSICVDSAVMAKDTKMPGRNPARENEIQRRRLRASVKDLAHYLQKISGAQIPIVTRPLPRSVAILVGSKAKERFGKVGISASFRQGLRIVVHPKKGIGLYGESDLATSYAIYGMLDQLGCRWFFPGELGETIPRSNTLTLRIQDTLDKPYTVYRGGGGYGFDEAFMRRNRMGGMLPPTKHCLEGGYISKAEKKKHPEWIAQYKDGRLMHNRLKWSNPQVSKRIAEIICERQKGNPQFFYCLSPDDGARFDESPADAALDAGDFDPTFQTTSLTDRAVYFYNSIVGPVAKKYPDVRFSALAYVQYTRPPVREKPHPNLVIQIAPITYSRAHPMSMNEVPDNDGLRHIVEGWGKVSAATSYYFYGYFLAEPMCIFPCLRKWANDVPYIYTKGGCRYWQPETFGNSEFFAMAQWMGQRMAWNPKQDPWDLYREANSRLYGAAATQMWAFWDAVDRAWIDTPEYSGCGFGHLHRFTPERLRKFRTLLNKAIVAAQAAPVKRRIEMVKTSLDLTEGFVALRRDLAEGRWKGLATRSKEWKSQTEVAAKKYLKERAFAHCWWAKSKTFAQQYFDWFYTKTHDSADRLASTKRLLCKQPVRSFRYWPDPKSKGESKGFAKPDFDDSSWKTTDTSYRTWSSMGHHNLMGSMWYRTKLDLSSVPKGKRIWLWLGATDGSAKVFVNGQPVLGGFEPNKNQKIKLQDAPGAFCKPMVFDITKPVRSGKNAIAIMTTRGYVSEVGTGGLLAPVVVFCDK